MNNQALNGVWLNSISLESKFPNKIVAFYDLKRSSQVKWMTFPHLGPEQLIEVKRKKHSRFGSHDRLKNEQKWDVPRKLEGYYDFNLVTCFIE